MLNVQNMNEKQEPLVNSERNIFIKQESNFKIETVDEFKNLQLNAFLTKNIEELQKAPGEALFLDSLHSVSEIPNSEVKASDLFVTNNDLNLIKQEVNEIEYIVPKVELLSEYCDLPTLKSDVEYLNEPSTSDHSQFIVRQYQQDGSKKKVKGSICAISQKNNSFSHRSLQHNDEHFRKRWMACEFCGYFYIDGFEYFLHYFKHCVKMNIKCLLNLKTNKQSIFKKQKHFNTQYKFGIRSKQFEKKYPTIKHIISGQKPKFNTHFKNHNGKTNKFETCAKQFIKRAYFSKHLKTHTNEKLFKCEICFKQFTKKPNFRKHLKIHTSKEQFTCKICFKKFTQHRYLKKHLKIHIGMKPFQCKICLANFTEKCNLNQHLKIHSGEKPFKCELCQKQFLFKHTLNGHLKTHTSEKPFKCEICSESFKFKQFLDVHLKIHSGGKSFKCEICFNIFTKKSNLIRHLTIHTGEKPFTCEICSKYFRQKFGLLRHLKTHT